MNTTVIHAEGLGKQYVLGQTVGRYASETLRESITRGWPFRRAPRDRIWALHDVGFDISEGEIVGLIGRNGAGKSTLLRILSRITKPTAGRVRISGTVASLLEVGTGFHPELTGRENIFLNGAVLGMKRADITRRFDEIVAFAEVERFIDTPVKRYSSGMYLRLAFSVAAHLEADILLVDEVLAVGDAAFQQKCLGKMSDVVHSGRTILFVSHNLSAISALCPASMWIDGGGIRHSGPTVDVIRAYVASVASGDTRVEIREDMHEAGYAGVSNIRLHAVELRNPFGDALSVRWREPVELDCVIEVKRDLSQVVFGLQVDAESGAAVFGAHHTDNEALPLSLGTGMHRLRISIQNPLQAGRYQLSLGAHNAVTRDILFQVQRAVSFDVLDIPYAATRYLGKYRCLVNGEAEWDILPERT